jgi:hypothetical protein
MSLRVEVEWLYTGPDEESLDYSRVLYAYLHPETSEVLYLGKADHCSVHERLRGPHKETIFRDIVAELRLSTLHAIVGLLSLPPERRFSSELLADVESLLIFELQPTYNIQSRQSRISRPGLVVQCSGDWPLRAKTFEDK